VTAFGLQCLQILSVGSKIDLCIFLNVIIITFLLKGMMMKTKAIVIVLIVCGLLSSPVFAVSYLFQGTTDTSWDLADNWLAGKPTADSDWVFIIADCDFDLATETIDRLWTDLEQGPYVGYGTLTVGSGTVLTVNSKADLGTYYINNNGKLNVAGGTVEIMGDGQDEALLFVGDGNHADVQVNVTDGGLLTLHASENTYDAIRFEDPTAGNNSSKITVSGTAAGSGVGVIELIPRNGRVPAINLEDDVDSGIQLIDEGYIKYVGCDAMDMIAEDADDQGGAFTGTLGGSTQMYTPEDVSTSDTSYKQSPDDGIAWYYDGSDTYLFAAAEMVLVDAGADAIRYEDQIAGGITMNGSLNTVAEDPNDFTFAWECIDATVTYGPQGSTVEDPNVFFPGLGTYTMKVTATGPGPYVTIDYVTYNLVVQEKLMVTHLAIDAGELAAAEAGGWTPAEYFKDSSLEGNPANHHLITYDGDDDWSDKQGVVGCGDNDSIASDDDGPIQLYLDHGAPGFEEDAPHLDNIDTGITVAFWYKGEDDKSQILIEKEDTFKVTTRQAHKDLQSEIMIAGETSYRVTKSWNSGDLGDDMDDAGLRIRSNGDGDDEAWHHIAITYTSRTGRVKHYVDGIVIVDDNDEFNDLTTPETRKLASYGTTKYLYLGGTDDSDDDLRKGGLDDIRIYNYALEGYEIAALASMGESVAMVNAGSSVTFDPNDTTWDPNFVPAVQLDGAFVKLGRGSGKINEGDSDNDNRILWEQTGGPGTATFANTSDPQTTVTFSEPGIYTLQLTAHGQFCGGSNDYDDSMTVTVLDAQTCAQVKMMGWNYAGDLDGDCDVDEEGLRLMAVEWLNVVP